MKKKRSFLGTFLIAAVLAGCAGENGMKSESVEVKAQAEYPVEPVYKSDGERWEAERQKEIPEAFRSSYGNFTYETSSALLRDGSENAVYSPLGLYYTLALAAEGAGGKTREEILNIVGYPDLTALSADLKQAFDGLYHVPNKENNKKGEGGEYPAESRYTLKIANSLWADPAADLKEEFARRGSEYYYSDIFCADMKAPETAKAMSAWVKERTDGLMAPAEESNGEALISLKNTVYFYDEWMDRFQKEKTKADTFTCSDNTKVTCEFMNKTMASHGFRKGENFTGSSMALKNGTVSFYLPDEGVSVRELVKSPEVFKEVLEGKDGQMTGEVVWKVPKFSYGSGMELNTMLEELGMESAFLEDKADFSGLSDVSPLFLSNVRQDAHIGIDENGVEAASYTEISWAGDAPPAGRAEMILDKPFLYVITNRGSVIFVGICENPAME